MIPDRELPRNRLLRFARVASERGFRRITAPWRVLPDFVVIGAQKSGSTTLFRNLQAHPDVLRPYRKEVHYFDNGWQRGRLWYRSFFPTAAAMRRAARRSGHRTVTGEGGPDYLFHPPSAARCREVLPRARLIAILRNPVDRAYSHYHHVVRKGHVRESFAEALAAEERMLAGEAERMLADEQYVSDAHRIHSLRARGRYAEQLERWYALYPREQILVLRSEDLFEEPRALLDAVSRFLGIRPFAPSQAPTPNPNPGGYAPVDPGLRAELAAYFRPHNERLYALVGRDFRWE